MENLFEKAKKSVIVIFYITFILAFFNTCNSCNRNRQTKNLIKEVDSLNIECVNLQAKIDTLKQTQLSPVDLQIEGLNAEKRMIQSCDRKIWDMNRQTAIDNSLDSLKKIKYSK